MRRRKHFTVTYDHRRHLLGGETQRRQLSELIFVHSGLNSSCTGLVQGKSGILALHTCTQACAQARVGNLGESSVINDG